MFLINNEETLQMMSTNAKKFVDNKPGSTELIINKILS